MEFIEWFVNSPVFDNARDEYFCSVEDKEIQLDEKAVDAVEDDCEKPQREKRKLQQYLSGFSGYYFTNSSRKSEYGRSNGE